MLTIPIAFAGGTEAQAAAAEGSYQEGQVSVTTQDGRKLRVGLPNGSSFLVGWAFVETALTVNPAAGGYATPQTLVGTSGYARHLCAVTLAAHSGAYTHKLILPATEASGVAGIDGTEYELQGTVPASTNPTLEIHNETVGGTMLWNFTGDGAAHVFIVRLLRSGGDWMRWGASEDSAA